MHQKWEYKITLWPGDEVTVSGLNRSGQEGWELVSVIMEPSPKTIYKRPVPEPSKSYAEGVWETEQFPPTERSK